MTVQARAARYSFARGIKSRVEWGSAGKFKSYALGCKEKIKISPSVRMKFLYV